eukprot:scaffold52683_cov69-Phaeocystis_antarctica.AAC.2
MGATERPRQPRERLVDAWRAGHGRCPVVFYWSACNRPRAGSLGSRPSARARREQSRRRGAHRAPSGLHTAEACSDSACPSAQLRIDRGAFASAEAGEEVGASRLWHAGNTQSDSWASPLQRLQRRQWPERPPEVQPRVFARPSNSTRVVVDHVRARARCGGWPTSFRDVVATGVARISTGREPTGKG